MEAEVVRAVERQTMKEEEEEGLRLYRRLFLLWSHRLVHCLFLLQTSRCLLWSQPQCVLSRSPKKKKKKLFPCQHRLVRCHHHRLAVIDTCATVRCTTAAAETCH